MGLKQKRVIESSVSDEIFYKILNTRSERQGVKVDPGLEWDVVVYTDGPLTFARIVHPTGMEFTGWSKFNHNDQNYQEINGICRALQRAVDDYLATAKHRDQSEEPSNVVRIQANTNTATARTELE